MAHKHKKNEQGFTLLEVLLASVILAVGLLGVAALQLTAINGNAYAMKVSEATRLASERIEELQNMADSDLALTSEDGVQEAVDGMTRTTAIAAGPEGTQQITVTVTWTDETETGQSHSIRLQTLL